MHRECFEIKRNLKSVVAFRNAFLQLCTTCNKEKVERVFLILVEPAVSEERLNDEWSKAKDVLSKSLSSKLSLVVIKNGEPTREIGKVSSSLRKRLKSLCKQESKHGRHLKRPKYQFEVLKLLVGHWLLDKEPVSIKWLMDKIDCSYPTVANAIENYKDALKYGPYRKVELARFPRKAWAELLTLSSDVRATVRYKDTSGQPRSPQSLLRRLKKLKLSNVAVGGTIGAREWYPFLGELRTTIDLEGDPRFDICVHEPGKSLQLDFVGKLDPALRETEDPKEPASLVVHVLRRETSFFEKDDTVGLLADPVECLLDLHELRLEKQAREYVKFLRGMKRDNG